MPISTAVPIGPLLLQLVKVATMVPLQVPVTNWFPLLILIILGPSSLYVTHESAVLTGAIPTRGAQALFKVSPLALPINLTSLTQTTGPIPTLNLPAKRPLLAVAIRTCVPFLVTFPILFPLPMAVPLGARSP